MLRLKQTIDDNTPGAMYPSPNQRQVGTENLSDDVSYTIDTNTLVKGKTEARYALV